MNTSNSDNKNLILKPIQALYIFRIIQEAITNSVKHSEADIIIVTATGNERSLDISVRDNGKGISESGNGMVNGNGIENMKKRAEEIGGKFEIINKSGRGVTINISVPV